MEVEYNITHTTHEIRNGYTETLAASYLSSDAPHRWRGAGYPSPSRPSNTLLASSNTPRPPMPMR